VQVDTIFDTNSHFDQISFLKYKKRVTTNIPHGSMEVWMDGWMYGWMGEWMDEWMVGGWTGYTFLLGSSSVAN